MPRKKAAAKAKPAEGMDVQSGQQPGPDVDAQKAETEAKFAAADAKGEPKLGSKAAEKAEAEAEEIRVGRQVRGY